MLLQVEPLLSSVDELQNLAAKIRDGRDSFASASGSLVGDLIDLGNYLIRTDPAYIDFYYMNSLIDEINGEISSVRYYSSALDDYDGSYLGASTRFDTRATGFTSAVRALQKQLREVTR